MPVDGLDSPLSALEVRVLIFGVASTRILSFCNLFPILSAKSFASPS